MLARDDASTVRFARKNLPLELPAAPSAHVRAVQEAFDILEPQGNFCVPPAVPPLSAWKLGVVLGASGGGKSSTLRLFEPDERRWFGVGQSRFDPDAPVVEQVHEDPGEAQRLLQDVGLKSVPAWLAPYRTMSTGQKARAELTRVLKELESGRMVAVDEFGSLLDPTTREALAYVFARAVSRRARDGGRVVVAVNDERLVPWLQPDWLFDVDACEYRFAERTLAQEGVREQLAKAFRLKRRGELLQGRVFEGPLPLRLTVRLAGSLNRRQTWEALKHHHYLDHRATGHLGFVLLASSPYLNAGKEVLAGLLLLSCNAGWSKSAANERLRFAARFVVAPSVQGLGIGPRAAAMVGEALARAGLELRFTTSHTALARSFEGSRQWATVKSPETGAQAKGTRTAVGHAKRPHRLRYFFKFVGGPGGAPALDPNLVTCSSGRQTDACDDVAHADGCYTYTIEYTLPPPWKR